MPRLFGQGHKYIQIDVDIHDNDKIEILRDQFEDAGFTFYVLFCCRVFDNAFFIELNERFVKKFCKKILRKTPEQFYEMLEFSITINLFDRYCYSEYKVITSRGIQRRYLFMARKWERIKLVKEYMLDDVDYHDSTYVLYDRQGNYIGHKKKQGEFTNEEFQKRLHIKSSETEPLPEKATSVIQPSKEFDLPESDLISDQILPNHFRDIELEADIRTYFHVNQNKNNKAEKLTVYFLTSLKNADKLTWFRVQWMHYKDYKDKVGYKHNFNTFIGSREMAFGDAVWDDENWQEKLKEFNNQNKNGSHKQVESKAEQGIASHTNFMKNFEQQ